jgi:RNA polymerase sigma-B factor
MFGSGATGMMRMRALRTQVPRDSRAEEKAMGPSTPQQARRPTAEPSDGQLARIVQSLPNGHPQRDAACEMLVARHRPIVRSCVRRYRPSPELAEDLMQVGYVGLLKAIRNFNPGFGDSLAAYAQVTVSGEIKRYFRDKRWQVRVRRSAQELRLRIRQAGPELTQQLSRNPRDAELARYLGVTETALREAQRADRAFQVASLDAPLPDGDGTGSLGDLLGADDPGIQRVIDMNSVRAHWRELPGREQRLLTMRFYGNMTQAQIGSQLGISQMHVSRLLTRALEYLREQITEGPRSPALAAHADG